MRLFVIDPAVAYDVFFPRKHPSGFRSMSHRKRLPAKLAYRLSVWKKGVNDWQWISHANFAPIF
jgi:hypothetical protein